MQDNREELSVRDYNAFSNMKLGLSNSTYTRPTLTHMDPRPENIVIRPIDDANGEGEKDRDVTLIDWKHCGWMPAYM
jgi:thiamine kinase-like enzyme